MGTVLASGKRTVSAALTVKGLKDDRQYQSNHHILDRAKWCSLTASKILLGLLVLAFVAAKVPIILGVDETLERRIGEKSKQKWVFRDAVRSNKNYLVHSFGLRWVSKMLILAVPLSSRPWDLPFLTLIGVPSEATNKANGKRHKTSIDWIQQMTCLVSRWLRGWVLVLVTDGGLTAVKLGLTCGALRQPVTWISRLRLDAGLYDWPGEQPKGKRGPKPKKEKRFKSNIFQIRILPIKIATCFRLFTPVARL